MAATTLPSRNTVASTTSPAWPISPTSKVPSNGPSKPPKLAPAASKPNRRLACSLENRSASTLQASEMVSRLNIDNQM
ncbi:hypothetical protein D3C76_1574770 [compost metagenome]